MVSTREYQDSRQRWRSHSSTSPYPQRGRHLPRSLDVLTLSRTTLTTVETQRTPRGVSLVVVGREPQARRVRLDTFSDSVKITTFQRRTCALRRHPLLPKDIQGLTSGSHRAIEQPLLGGFGVSRPLHAAPWAPARFGSAGLPPYNEAYRAGEMLVHPSARPHRI